jgi:hypothetical protein
MQMTNARSLQKSGTNSKIGDESYDFIADSGANMSLVQPCVSEGVHNNVENLVSYVTENILKTHDSRYTEFQFCRNTYHHNFIIVQFFMKWDRTIGLGTLRVLGAKVDFVTINY